MMGRPGEKVKSAVSGARGAGKAPEERPTDGPERGARLDVLCWRRIAKTSVMIARNLVFVIVALPCPANSIVGVPG